MLDLLPKSMFHERLFPKGVSEYIKAGQPTSFPDSPQTHNVCIPAHTRVYTTHNTPYTHTHAYTIGSKKKHIRSLLFNLA